MEASDISKKKAKGAYHHGDLRQQLLNAARELVDEKGPDAFSVSEACRLAGVSTAAPYRHFKDKREMLVGVATEGMRRMHVVMEETSAPYPVGSLDALAAMGAAYVQFAQDEQNIFRLMFGLTSDHEADPEMMDCGAANYGLLLQHVSVYTGIPMEDETLRAKSFPLWTLVHGTSFLLIDGKVKAMELSVDIPTMIRNATRGLLGEPVPA